LAGPPALEEGTPADTDPGELQEARVERYLATVKGALRIPFGTLTRICRRCPAAVWFVGKVPVSLEPYKDGPRGIEPTAMEDGAGIAHYATCPNAADFRKKR
jgi:hypothetical protein